MKKMQKIYRMSLAARSLLPFSPLGALLRFGGGGSVMSRFYAFAEAMREAAVD